MPVFWFPYFRSYFGSYFFAENPLFVLLEVRGADPLRYVGMCCEHVALGEMQQAASRQLTFLNLHRRFL